MTGSYKPSQLDGHSQFLSIEGRINQPTRSRKSNQLDLFKKKNLFSGRLSISSYTFLFVVTKEGELGYVCYIWLSQVFVFNISYNCDLNLFDHMSVPLDWMDNMLWLLIFCIFICLVNYSYGLWKCIFYFK